MKHVIIGASAAGLNAAQTLRRLCPEDEITVVSPEDKIYSRCLLHQVISGQRNGDSINFMPPDFFVINRIHWVKGKTVASLNTGRKQVYLKNGGALDYHTLLIASGAHPFVPPIPNLRTANQVFTLRELADATAIGRIAKPGTEAVIIGGGLIGIDAAVGLAAKGARVSIIEMADRILPLQLDNQSAARYEQLFTRHGINILTGKAVQEVLINEAQDVVGIRLNDGQTLRAGLIVVAAGVRPNTEWIDDQAISISKGIVTDDGGRTTADAVFAAGDVVGRAGIWPLAVKQGITAAYNMAGRKKALEDTFSLKNSLNFFGLPTISLGVISEPDDSYQVDIYETPQVYKKVIHQAGIVYGAIFQGDLSHCGVWASIIGNQLDISRIAKKSIFDIDYSDFFKINEQGQFYY